MSSNSLKDSTAVNVFRAGRKGQLRSNNSSFCYLQSLSNDELLALLRAAWRARERDWLMILVAYWHGLRASEVTSIQRQDVSDGYLTVRRLKGSLRTIQPLIEHEIPLLNERRAFENFVAAMRPNQKVFPIGRIWFWRLVQRY